MKILFTTGSDRKFGEMTALLGLIQSLKEAHADLHISVALMKGVHSAEPFLALGCDVYMIPYAPFCETVPDNSLQIAAKYVIRGARYFYGRQFALHELEKQMDLATIDIVHSNSSREDFGASIAEKYGKPLIWHIREFGDRDFRLYSYRRKPVDFMKSHASEFIAVSDGVCGHWIQKGLPADRIVRIYDGVKELSEGTRPDCAGLKADNVSAASDNRDSPFHVILAGGIHKEKGQWQAIEAVSCLPEAYKSRIRLDLAGDGRAEYVRGLKAAVSRLGLEGQVHFTGFMKELRSHLPEYDCGLMCSRCEGFGLVTVEYMMAGLLVIASDAGANTEILSEGETGLFYHCSDTQDLKDWLIYAMDHQEEMRVIGRNAARAAKKRFTVKRNAEAVYLEYEKVISETTRYPL